MQIYLGSKSPRRQSLLSQIGVDFECLSVEIDESVRDNELVKDYVERMAKEKAEAAWLLEERSQYWPLLSADTCIALEGQILGKPEDTDSAKLMLSYLSNKTHQVLTSVAIKMGSQLKVVTSITDVTFGILSSGAINNYVKTGDCMDKAGSYGIQGYAARFVSHISGSYSGVVGLPLYETARLLESFKTA
jgi:septum formation protein